MNHTALRCWFKPPLHRTRKYPLLSDSVGGAASKDIKLRKVRLAPLKLCEFGKPPSTQKPGMDGPRTSKTGQITPLDGFHGGFADMAVVSHISAMSEKPS